jgi:hypothetical protein
MPASMRLPEQERRGPEVNAAMRRKEFLVALAGATAGASLLGRVGRAMADDVPGSCIWGIGDTYNLDKNFATYCDQLEVELGRPFAGLRLNGGFTKQSADFNEIHRMVNAGRHWTYVNGKPAGTATGYWQAIVAGQYDVPLNAFIALVQSDPTWTTAQPLHFSFHHEQYVKAEGGGFAAGTAQDFIAAFQHVRSLVDQAGAHISQGGNILMCWTPHWRQFYHDPVYGVGGGTTAVKPYVVTLCDPGPAYYDLIGVDMYNQANYSFTAVGQWTPVQAYASVVGRPFLSAETGIGGTDAKVVPYLQQMDALLKGWGAGWGPGQVVGICWTSRGAKYSDFHMDLTPARLAQYAAMATDPFYSLVV